MTTDEPSRVLVLGAYGLIGANVARALADRGHDVLAFGRDKAAAHRVLPDFPWLLRDMRALIHPDDWKPLIDGVDMVVNCAGALQDNAQDNLELVHLHAIGALVLACEKAGVGLVQISASGARPDAPLPFFRTKADGDALIREAQTDWWIFRPGLVIAPSSYGGTTLIRMLAGVPIIQPVALPAAPVQTVSVQDVSRAVVRAVERRTPPGTEADLVEAEPRPLVDIISGTRRWLGFAPARVTLAIPLGMVRLIGRIADGLGKLGWRSPMRSTALAAIEMGVTGNPAETRKALGRPALTLEETFQDMPAAVEDRLFARVQLLTPLLIFALALSWVWRGAAGLGAIDRMAETLAAHGMPVFTGRIVVGAISAMSIVLGLSLFVRRWAVRVLVVMVFVAIFYGAALTLLAPYMWGDPFGAGANLLLVIVAALATRVMMDTR
ncbi:NAD(P)H-binding protein [Sinisalibacter aestuarii]|uniref:NAD(P)-binding domain-containing protein n=1 Tax=Sinisalibacter aestuarii TaxID=2949426 RepID=A0ABQ5LSR2_9RHOB|nr:NAD(P)H-binding protein [Sinisalibacter aestuarii]GKY87296.1 hypothetical protein STA1M1_11650 [Sinisalibacter aestuarii]